MKNTKKFLSSLNDEQLTFLGVFLKWARTGVGDHHEWVLTRRSARLLVAEMDAALADAQEAADADYSPAYQDEYQRLWHKAAAERDEANMRLHSLRWQLGLDTHEGEDSISDLEAAANLRALRKIEHGE